MEKQQMNDCNVKNLKYRIIFDKTTDGRLYTQPTVSKVAAMIFGDVDTS